jgi:hypothetical protein
MSFQEYVLVGEVDDGICGDPSATWGVRGRRLRGLRGTAKGRPRGSRM